MPDPDWTAEIQRIYESIHEITPQDEAKLEQANFSEDRLRGAFEEGFIDKDVHPDDRQAAREAYFEWMEYLGYDTSEFDWDAWRETFPGDTP